MIVDTQTGEVLDLEALRHRPGRRESCPVTSKAQRRLSIHLDDDTLRTLVIAGTIMALMFGY